MKIAFDVLPLVSSHMSGIGYCQSGQIRAMMALHPDNNYKLQFFPTGDRSENLERLSLYINHEHRNVSVHQGKFSGYLYRLISNFIPLPYSAFFGKDAEITHFFNYIIPPGVAGAKVVTVHDMVYKAYPETVRGRTRYMLETGLKRSLKRANLIITDSEFSKKEIIKYFPWTADKLRVVYCGVDRNRFYPVKDNVRIEEVKKSMKIDGDYFLYLGTLEPRKNLERLVKAYSVFSKKYSSPPKLVLAGGSGWYNEGLFNTIKELKIEDKIIRTEYVFDECICPLMCGALAFVFPSLYEGFGMPPLEAMACGAPVLTSNVASLPEVVGDCAVLVDPYSIDEIAEGLDKLYNNPDIREKLGELGQKRAAMFSWENAAAVLYDVYKEILDGREK